MEDFAEDYLEELIQRSMIQATVRNFDGRVIRCRIHDLIRDLALSEAMQERFLEVLGSDNLISTNKSYRISIIEPTGGMYSRPSSAINQHTMPNHLRSLLCFSPHITKNTWMKPLYGAMKLLRVLDLVGAGYSIPSSSLKHIGKLVLLKYLGLRIPDVIELPSSIGDLENLQTLDLCSTSLKQIPMVMMKLQQLRNIVFCCKIDGVSRSFDCPLDHMTNLRTLSIYEGKWMEGRLDKLTNLRTLTILSVGSLAPYKEALLNGIPKLKHLWGLRLKDESLIFGTNKEALVLPVSFSNHLELYHMTFSGIIGIQDFPSNLTTLILGFQIRQDIDELMATLKKPPKLRCLILDLPCLGSKIIFSAGGFHQLEELVFINTQDLEFTVEEGALPNFRVLRILGHGLTRLPQGLKQVVTLQELTLSCISEELEYRVRKGVGEDWEIIKHIPSIDTKSEWSPSRSPHAFRHWY